MSTSEPPACSLPAQTFSSSFMRFTSRHSLSSRSLCTLLHWGPMQLHDCGVYGLRASKYLLSFQCIDIRSVPTQPSLNQEEPPQFPFYTVECCCATDVQFYENLLRTIIRLQLRKLSLSRDSRYESSLVSSQDYPSTSGREPLRKDELSRRPTGQRSARYFLLWKHDQFGDRISHSVRVSRSLVSVSMPHHREDKDLIRIVIS